MPIFTVTIPGSRSKRVPLAETVVKVGHSPVARQGPCGKAVAIDAYSGEVEARVTIVLIAGFCVFAVGAECNLENDKNAKRLIAAVAPTVTMRKLLFTILWR